MFSQRHHFISTIKFCRHFSRKFTSSHIFFSLNFISLPSQSQHHFYKKFLQHAAFCSSKLAFFFLIFTLNTIFARDFCNMLHFSLLNLPRSAKLAAKTQKPPKQDKPASGAIKLKCQNELLYFSKLSLSSKKSYMFTVRIPYSS